MTDEVEGYPIHSSLMRTRNNANSNKRVIFSGIALYYGDTYTLRVIISNLIGYPNYNFVMKQNLQVSVSMENNTHQLL